LRPIRDIDGSYFDASEIDRPVVIAEVPVAETQDALAGAEVEDFRAVNLDLEVVREIDRREERARARGVMIGAFVEVLVDEDSVVEREDFLFQKPQRSLVLLRLLFGEFRHDMSPLVCDSTRWRAPVWRAAGSPKGHGPHGPSPEGYVPQAGGWRGPPVDAAAGPATMRVLLTIAKET
jgi:hypothetical protein